MSKKHNHGASISGGRSEDKVQNAVEQVGFRRLHKKEHFKNQGKHSYEGTVRLPKPKKYTKAKEKRTNNFITDGLIVNPKNIKAAIIESKYSGAHGTTEEKVFYDLFKIEDGIYGAQYPLVYLFQGPICESVNEYRLFADEAERRNLPVHVIFDPTPDLSKFKRFMRKLLA